MRFRQLTFEAIPNKPRSMHYFTMRAKELRQIETTLKQVSPLLDRIEFPRNLQYAADDLGISLDHYEFESFGRAITNSFGQLPIGDLANSIETFVTHTNPGYDFYQYIPERLKYTNEQLERWRDWIIGLPTVEQAHQIVNQEDAQLLNPEYQEPEEIQQVQVFLKVIEILSPTLKGLLKVLENLDYKIGAQRAYQDMVSAHNWDRKALRPKHEEVELLYHATAYANEIMTQGFAAEKPIDKRGVGNFGDQSLISFTHDQKIAMDIVRCLKEIAMIANGQLKARTIADWIRRENIQNFPWNDIMLVNTGVNQYGMSQYSNTTLDKLSMEKIAELYNKYIWLSKIHPNPVFVSVGELVKTLVGRPLNDIGIVQCEVRLDPNQTEYHPGESEFRVPPSAVLSVKRVM